MIAYPETYLNDAMNNLGDMFDYAICDCDYGADDFFGYFIKSGVARSFERGHPKYIAGMSGTELAAEVVWRTFGTRDLKEPSVVIDKSPEYWAGWALAYYQWQGGLRFSDFQNYGLNMDSVLFYYKTLHEADITRFIEVADSIIARGKLGRESNLKRIRNVAHMTQKQLAEASGVSLRMIQLYEQRQQDIRKAEAQSLVYLSKVLRCDVEDLFD